MHKTITYRRAETTDVLRLSVFFKQVYIHTYATDGVSTEFANFITKQFSEDRLLNAIMSEPDTLWVAAYKDNLVGVAEIAFNKKCPLGDITAPELNKLISLNISAARVLVKGCCAV